MQLRQVGGYPPTPIPARDAAIPEVAPDRADGRNGLVTASRRVLLAGGLAAAGALARPARAAAEPLSLRRGIALWPWFSLTTEFPAPRIDYAWPPFQADRPIPERGRPAPAGRASASTSSGCPSIPVPSWPSRTTGGPNSSAACRPRSTRSWRPGCASCSTFRPMRQRTTTRRTPSTARIGRRCSRSTAISWRELARLCARKGSGRTALEPVNEPPQACGAEAWNRVQAELLGRGPRGRAVADPRGDRLLRQPRRWAHGARSRHPSRVCAASLHLPLLRAVPVLPPGRAVAHRGAVLPVAERGALARLAAAACGRPWLRSGPAWIPTVRFLGPRRRATSR